MNANMYAGYNKGESAKSRKGARLGNWVEEIALEAATGSSRGLDLRDKTAGMATPHRVIYHTEREEAKDYRSTGFREDPRANVEHKAPAKLGPRATARAALVDADTDRLASTERAEPDPRTFLSSQREAHAAPPASWYGENNGVGTVDGVVKPESGGETVADRRAALDAELDACEDAPVTIHEQAIAGQGGVYTGTAAGGRNPLGRCTTFTNDIRNGTQRHAGATDMGGGVVTKMPPTAMQAGAIERLRKVGGAGGFWAGDEGFVAADEFVDGLQEFGCSGADVQLLLDFFTDGRQVDLQEVNQWLA